MIQDILDASTKRFGRVVGILDIDGEFKLFIKKDNPTFVNQPYMIIRARMAATEVSFYYGRYDLTEDQAKEHFLR